MTANTPPPITTAQMEAAAEMTYDPYAMAVKVPVDMHSHLRIRAELEVVRNVVDARLDALKSQQAQHHLIKVVYLSRGSKSMFDVTPRR